MAVTGQRVISKATQYLGYGGTTVWNFYGLTKGTAWCAAFVSFIMNKAGAKNLFYDGKPVFYVPYAQQWLKAHCKHVKMAEAKAGDIVIFTWDGNGYNSERGSRDHIGFIRKSGTSNTAYTIEGNTSGSKVDIKSRNVRYIYGIYRPNYPKTTTTTTTKPATSTTKLTVDGDWGPATTLKTKKLLKLSTSNSIISGLPTSSKKYLPAANTASWKFTSNKASGSATVKALQKLVGVKMDGFMGPVTVKALQKFLDKKGWNPGAIDGYMGEKTVKAWQKYLNKALNLK